MIQVEKINYKKDHFNLYADKNGSVFDVKRCNVLSWKTIEKGHRKITVPDEVEEVRDIHFFNKVKGNPLKIAANRILAELEIKFK
jgi:hypothetical protein